MTVPQDEMVLLENGVIVETPDRQVYRDLRAPLGLLALLVHQEMRDKEEIQVLGAP